MLEVVITERSPTSWEWRVRDRHRTTIVNGVEGTRQAAKQSGEQALFLLLAYGWER